MMHPCRCGIVILVVLFCIPAIAVADDDAPYAPKKFSVDDLILTDQFNAPPLAFPWDRISSQRVSNHGRMDFELVYDVDYDTVLAFLQQANTDRADFIEVESHALRYTDIAALNIVGHEFGDTSSRISVSHSDIEPVFTVDLEADGNRTRVTIMNMLRTRQFSGFMPSRVDHAPSGAEPIPFRSN